MCWSTRLTACFQLTLNFFVFLSFFLEFNYLKTKTKNQIINLKKKWRPLLERVLAGIVVERANFTLVLLWQSTTAAESGKRVARKLVRRLIG